MTEQQIKLAQISDLHLPFPNWPPLRELNLKRLLGLLNWWRGRRALHKFVAVNAMINDLKSQNPDHIAVTGDLVNLGLPKEYRLAETWLRSLGPPELVSVIPGNHDIYCPVEDQNHCCTIWSDYMQSDAVGTSAGLLGGDTRFPFLRQIGPVALIGANSAVPTPPFIAQGDVSKAQQERLRSAIRFADARGLFPVVMVHHPPLAGLTTRRRALRNADALTEVFRTEPVGLVLYGHNHKDTITWLKRDDAMGGAVAICGAASASTVRTHKTEPPARYYCYDVHVRGDTLNVVREARGFGDGLSEVVSLGKDDVSPRKT